jgi:isoleucyl-tRNA synthetase
MLAPYCPFITDAMYRNLVPDGGSVHVTDWPAIDTAAVDDALEAEMATARQLASLGRAARTDAKIGVRQPLPRAIARLGTADALRPEVVNEVADELNVKRFEVVATLEGLLAYHVVPNFRALGPRLGKQLPRVKELLAAVDGADVQHAFDRDGRYALDVDGARVELERSDVEIRAEQHEELALAQDGRYAVALDLTLDDDLRAEGLARELSRAINDLRKAKGFDISDRVTLRYGGSDAVMKVMERFGEWIATEVLATACAPFEGAVPASADRVEIAGEAIDLELARAG